jgi:hypothetical protein
VHVDCDGVSVDPVELMQPLHEGGKPRALCFRRAGAKEAEDWLAGLCLRNSRQRHCRSTVEEEFTPLHSITSDSDRSNALSQMNDGRRVGPLPTVLSDAED